MTTNTNNTATKKPCHKCGGKGSLKGYDFSDFGRCWACMGSGFALTTQDKIKKGIEALALNLSAIEEKAAEVKGRNSTRPHHIRWEAKELETLRSDWSDASKSKKGLESLVGTKATITQARKFYSAI